MQVSKADLKNILNADGENDVVQHTTVEDLGREIAGVPDSASDAELSGDDSEEEELYSVRKQLQSLAIAKETLERHGHLTEACSKAFYNCQHELRLEKQRGLAQTNIEDFFSKK